MLQFLLRRAPAILIVLLGCSVIAFFIPRFAPGDPAIALAGSDATAADIEAIREQLGLNVPLPIQYVNWMGGLLRGDLGISYSTMRPVAELIGSRLESTVELALSATLIMVLLGIVLGVLAGSERSGWARAVLDSVNTVMLATPPFLTGLLLILLLGIVFPVLPVSGEVSLLDDPWLGFQFLILPATALALPNAAVIARLVATSMQTVRREEFIDFAVAKGVPARLIRSRHVLRNSLGTGVVAIGLRIGDLLAGTIVTEAIFARSGLGQLAVTSVQSRDYSVIQVLIVGAIFIAIIAQLLTEIALAALDPRIRLGATTR